MTGHLTHDKTALTGIMLMVATMLVLPGVDGVAKLLTGTHSPLLVCWARYASACLFALPLALARFGGDFLPRENIGAHVMRTFYLVGAMIFYFLAIARIPLADAISAYFVGPIVAMVLAIVLLGEQITWRKATSLALGFAGAMFVVQPAGAVEPGTLLALGAGVLFAAYMIATRQTSLSSDPVKTLAFQCLFGALILSPLAYFTWTPPADGELWLFLLMGLISVTGHMLSILAFRFADASTLAPFVYVELIGSVIMGYLLFGDWPGSNVWIGAAAIVAGGAILINRRSNTQAFGDATDQS